MVMDHDDEIRRLETRIRGDVFLIILAFLVQLALLGKALGDGVASSWWMWALALLTFALAMFISGRRARRSSKRYRRLKWNEE